VVGVCGGYQMLGRRILDPDGIESKSAATTGLALLDVESSFQRDKVTARVKATEVASGLALAGYEIHAGRVTRAEGAAALFKITEREGAPANDLEGAQSEDGRAFGTSIHGLFDSAEFRRSFLNRVRAAKGLPPHADCAGEDFKAVRERAYDQMADVAAQHLDLRRLLALAGIT
jgi:adenosylcobyric acid synthase